MRSNKIYLYISIFFNNDFNICWTFWWSRTTSRENSSNFIEDFNLHDNSVISYDESDYDDNLFNFDIVDVVNNDENNGLLIDNNVD